MVLKIGFEKIYDYVDKGLLDHALARKGFSTRWRIWMRGCMPSTNFEVLESEVLNNLKQLEV